MRPGTGFAADQWLSLLVAFVMDTAFIDGELDSPSQCTQPQVRLWLAAGCTTVGGLTYAIPWAHA